MTALSRRLQAILILAFLCPGFSSFAQESDVSSTYREAYDAGFQEGTEAGREDRRTERTTEIATHETYQSAQIGFDPQKHDKDVYYVAFRRGFEDGYASGFGHLTDKKPRGPAPPPQPVSLRHTAEISTDETRPLPSRYVRVRIGTEVNVRLLDTISTGRNERGDVFGAETTEDIAIEGEVAVPRGTPIQGKIAYLRRAGRIKGRAEMKLLFYELHFSDSAKVHIDATVKAVRDRPEKPDGEGNIEGRSSKAGDTAKVGASAAIGALIGLISGGKKGGAIGAGAGAIIGLGGVLGSRGKDIVLAEQTELLITFDREALIPVPSAAPSP